MSICSASSTVAVCAFEYVIWPHLSVPLTGIIVGLLTPWGILHLPGPWSPAHFTQQEAIPKLVDTWKCHWQLWHCINPFFFIQGLNMLCTEIAGGSFNLPVTSFSLLELALRVTALLSSPLMVIAVFDETAATSFLPQGSTGVLLTCDDARHTTIGTCATGGVVTDCPISNVGAVYTSMVASSTIVDGTQFSSLIIKERLLQSFSFSFVGCFSP